MIMIRLDLPKEPYWMDMPHGVRLFVRPLTTAVYEAASARGRRLARQLCEEYAEVKAVGGSIEGLPDVSDPDAVAGLSQLIFVQALARSAVVAWEGVAAANGTRAPVTPGNVDALMLHHRVAEAFVVDYTRTLAELVSEGNASRPSPSGTSAAGRATAKGAGTAEAPAPAAG